jgi:hypothetical protein
VVLALARTSFFIDHIVGFGFVNTMAEADWRSGSARHLVSFADRKPGPLNPFLSDSTVRVQFCRRKVIWDAISSRIAKGKSEAEAVAEIERLRGGGSLNRLVDTLK